MILKFTRFWHFVASHVLNQVRILKTADIISQPRGKQQMHRHDIIKQLGKKT